MLEVSFISSCQTNNKQTSKTGFEYKCGAAANPDEIEIRDFLPNFSRLLLIMGETYYYCLKKIKRGL